MNIAPKSLVLATGNGGKIRELNALFGRTRLEIRSLKDFEGIQDIDETGVTFTENAELKAVGFARQTGRLSVADDSGLEVAALGNAPGVYSARFAGKDTGYDAKIKKLLAMLDESRNENRRARFVCVMALADPDRGVIHTAEGVCHGTIAHGPRGENGFGYDPIFVPDGFEETFGELPDDIKRRISHRARAAELIIRYLLDNI